MRGMMGSDTTVQTFWAYALGDQLHSNEWATILEPWGLVLTPNNLVSLLLRFAPFSLLFVYRRLCLQVSGVTVLILNRPLHNFERCTTPARTQSAQ